MLWAFDIEMAVDRGTGESIVPDCSIETGFREGLTLCAKDFPVNLNVRSAGRRKAVEESFKAACTDVFARYEDMSLDSI